MNEIVKKLNALYKDAARIYGNNPNSCEQGILAGIDYCINEVNHFILSNTFPNEGMEPDDWGIEE